MSRSYQYGEEERGERSKEGDTVRVLAKESLSHLNHPIHTARGLQNARTRNGSDDDVNHVSRRCTWFQAKSKYENGKSDSRDCTKGKATIP